MQTDNALQGLTANGGWRISTRNTKSTQKIHIHIRCVKPSKMSQVLFDMLAKTQLDCGRAANKHQHTRGKTSSTGDDTL